METILSARSSLVLFAQCVGWPLASMTLASKTLASAASAFSEIDALLDWYGDCQRDLPWRRGRNPYHSWICEVMSQQTTLAVVVPRFLRFIEVLPTVQHLATCDDATLRSLWSGLGYYARARNLRKGAVHIAESRGGLFPASYAEWLLVPGVGPYTAAVIASINCNEPVACVDGNVVRVVSRLLALSHPKDVWSVEASRRIQTHVQSLLNHSIRALAHPGDFNQAMMELGATLCTKHAPRCEVCPVAEACEARKQGVQAACPPAKPRKSKKNITLHVISVVSGAPPSSLKDTPLASCSARVLFLERRRGFLKGTRGLPLATPQEFLSLQKLLSSSFQAAGTFSHTITHHALTVVTQVYGVSQPVSAAQCGPDLRVVENFTAQSLGAEALTWIPVSQVPAALSTSLDTKAWNTLAPLLEALFVGSHNLAAERERARESNTTEACQNP